MSQDDDSPVANAVSKSENDSTTNKTNTAGPVNVTPNKPVAPDNLANNVNSQEMVYKIRENMVSKAVEFLIDGSIQQTPIERKVNFLRSKGLTDHEITVSLQRAAARCNQNSYTINASLFPSPADNNSLNMNGVVQTPFQAQSWYRRLFGPIAFAATVAFVAFQLYKKYIENWLFGVRKPSVEDRMEAIESSLQKVLLLLEYKNNTPDTFYYENKVRDCENSQLRAELKTIKSLLLNKSQFPPAPMASSIPQWQLPKNVKPQVEQQNKINGIDTPINQNQLNGIHVPSTSKQNIINNILTPSTLPQGIPNELNKGPEFDLPTSVIDSDNVINETSSTSNDTPIGTALPVISDQSIIKCDNVVGQSDESKHDENLK